MDIAVATRPIQDDDEERFYRLWPRLSAETRYRRFHSPVHRLPASFVHHLVHVDHDARDAVVAVVGGEVVGVARYDRSPTDPSVAEFAILVEDAWQARGLGTALAEHAATVARREGHHTLAAAVAASNKPMLHVLEKLDATPVDATGPVLDLRILL